MSLVAVVLALAAPGQARNCESLFTPPMGRRAALTVYRGVRRVSLRNLRLLGTIERCQRNPRDQVRVRAFDRRQAARWKARRSAALSSSMSPALASWYFDQGSTACGFHATYGFASLTLPCGARVLMRGPSGATVTAVMQDRGPYVSGRTFDLNPALKQALGCPDLCWLRYRVL